LPTIPVWYGFLASLRSALGRLYSLSLPVVIFMLATVTSGPNSPVLVPARAEARERSVCWIAFSQCAGCRPVSRLKREGEHLGPPQYERGKITASLRNSSMRGVGYVSA